MGLIKPVGCLRSKNHLHTRLALRDEVNFARMLLPKVAPLYVAFGLVDWLSAEHAKPFLYFGLRIGAVAASKFFFLISRGRARYGVRFFLLFSPFLFAIQYIMISQKLALSPYFAGLALVMLTATTYFPVRAVIAAIVYSASVVPLLIWLAINPTDSMTGNVNIVLMTLGSVILSTVNSSQIYKDFKARLILKEVLSRDLGKREKEIRSKADQLFRRRTFESQFSPQVVSAVLNDGKSVREMRQRSVVVIVVDIENSTNKAKTLDPTDYKNVIEEVFDVFGSACLKWNITVDKFTGDGAQAFAGAPVAEPNDMYRALMACKDTLYMLKARQFLMEPRWKGALNVRLSVCEGQALVGFLGRGTLKSFTAIGETVSFAHRLCGASEPGAIAACSLTRPGSLDLIDVGFSSETRTITNLKGFGDMKFFIKLLRPVVEEVAMVDNGRCTDCETPLVLEDGPGGFPRVTCPGCQSRNSALAA